MVVVAGASGAGKSSLLRCIAGLVRPDAGSIRVGARTLFDSAAGIDLPVHQRHIGVVFQDSRLFPHMSVRENLAYGQRSTGESGAGVQFSDVVDVLGIGHLLARRPRALSGGEMQRVAIGRALLTNPRLLLMDEPLASLDRARKDEVLPFLAELPRRFSVPILYVTHSVDELLQMADEVVVMAEGRVVSAGPVVGGRFALGHAAGDDSVFECVLGQHDPVPQLMLADGLPLFALGLDGLAAGTRVRVRIPADDVTLAVGAVPPMSVRNRLATTVESVEDAARGVRVELRLDAAPKLRLRAMVSRGASEELGLRRGLSLTALVKAASVRIPGLKAVR